MYSYIDSFMLYLQAEKNCSARTLDSYRKDLFDGVDFFAGVLKKKDYDITPGEITYNILRQYLSNLRARGSSRATMSRKLSTWRGFCRF